MNKIIDLINSLIRRRESEVVEFKEAKNDFSFEDLGKYFSALSNEANLRGLHDGYLLLGIRNNGDICGSRYKQTADMSNESLLKLKKNIASRTNTRATFRDIYEEEIDGKRVLLFVIPAASRGVPTLWNDRPWSRVGDSLETLTMSKYEEILRQPPLDWSKQIVGGATLEHLDGDAIQIAKAKVKERYGERASLIENLDDEELLDKMGMTFRGAVTNTGLILLGSADSLRLFSVAAPKITWSLYESNGRVRSYEHFSPPFILSIDALLAKIRNEKYRLISSPNTLLPSEQLEYDTWSIRELISNAIAHQDYVAGGKINVEEFPDRLVFMNEGQFIPGSVEVALSQGYKPPYYRNPFLCEAMINVGMLDQNAMGMREVYERARSRRMPLPTYDLRDESRVKVTLLNHELNSSYTHWLTEDPNMPIDILLALDKVQKNEVISDGEADRLLELNMISIEPDGKARIKEPPSSQVAKVKLDEQPGQHDRPGVIRRIDRPLLKSAIVMTLKEKGSLSRKELLDNLKDSLELGNSLRNLKDPGQTVYNALNELRKEGIVRDSGSTRNKIWFLN